MDLLGLFVTASVPVLNVLLLTAVGSYSATNRIGILNGDARKHLNNVVFFIFNPALNAVNLSRTITLESMVLLWFLPTNLLLNVVIGSLLGWVVIQILKPPARLRGVILASCSAGNVGNLLLILIPAICKEKANTFGAPEVCNTYGLAYASLSMAIGTILQWSYVFNIVRISLNSIDDKVDYHISNTRHTEESIEPLLKGCREEVVSTSDDLVPTHALIGSPPSLSISGIQTAKTKIFDKIKNFLTKLYGAVDLKKLFAPPTIGVIIGFIVGATPQLRKAIIGESAPFRTIRDSAALLGNGTIPSLILITGGNLTKGLHGPSIKFSLIIGVVIVRYIALPTIGIALVKGAIHLGLVHRDPLYEFILLLQYAVPPAMNITSMIQMFEAGEGELSVIFLWTYTIASVALTLWSMLFLWLVS